MASICPEFSWGEWELQKLAAAGRFDGSTGRMYSWGEYPPAPSAQ
jgi:hypothetical protein